MIDWSFFFTVAYKNERNKNSCFKQIHGVYDYLAEKYGNSTRLRLFFTTESFTDRKGYHNHFVIYIEDKRLHEPIVMDIHEYLSYDRVVVSIYDKNKVGLFYIFKEGLTV